MKACLLILAILGVTAVDAQEISPQPALKSKPGAVIERFTLTGARSYEGIWDGAKSQIHVVSKSNHVRNVTVKSSEILSRREIGDGSSVILYSDLDLAEKAVLLHQAAYKAAQARFAAANQRNDALHKTYKGKTLPQAQYKVVIAQYAAAEAEVNKAQNALGAAKTALTKSHEEYVRLGGKKQFTLP